MYGYGWVNYHNQNIGHNLKEFSLKCHKADKSGIFKKPKSGSFEMQNDAKFELLSI